MVFPQIERCDLDSAKLEYFKKKLIFFASSGLDYKVYNYPQKTESPIKLQEEELHNGIKTVHLWQKMRPWQMFTFRPLYEMGKEKNCCEMDNIVRWALKCSRHFAISLGTYPGFGQFILDFSKINIRTTYGRVTFKSLTTKNTWRHETTPLFQAYEYYLYIAFSTRACTVVYSRTTITIFWKFHRTVVVLLIL